MSTSKLNVDVEICQADSFRHADQGEKEERRQMLMQADVSVEAGDTLELWARRRPSATSIPSPALTIFSGDRIVFRIALLPPYFEHFAHTHYSRETLRLEWDSDEIEPSLFYRYNPATVRDEGISLLRL